jgi:hypothetical protein
MLLKISFGKRSNRHPECVPQAIRIVILSRADGEGSLMDVCVIPNRADDEGALNRETAALGAIRYARGLRANIFPRPDFQTKCERMAEETVFFATAIARGSTTPFANSAVIAAE